VPEGLASEDREGIEEGEAQVSYITCPMCRVVLDIDHTSECPVCHGVVEVKEPSRPTKPSNSRRFACYELGHHFVGPKCIHCGVSCSQVQVNHQMLQP
jgi:hypothetical protein